MREIFDTSLWRAIFALVVLGVCPSFAETLEPSPGFTPEIEIYTAGYCGECRRAKAYMQDRGIAFAEHDVEKDPAQLRQFYERGGRGIPYLFVHGRPMHGFDPERFEALRARRD